MRKLRILAEIVANQKHFKADLMPQRRGYRLLLHKSMGRFVRMLVIKGDARSQYLSLSTFKAKQGVVTSMLRVCYKYDMRRL